MNKKKKDGLIVFSGGMDSTVLLHMNRNEIALAVTFDYGSKHNAREYSAACEIIRSYDIPLLRVDLSATMRTFRSSLIQSGEPIPEGHYEDETMRSTVVPFRNGIMISLAVGVAESEGLRTVYYGAHAGDHAIYPDCRPAFLQGMAKAARAGTYGGIQVRAPFIHMSKRGIAMLGYTNNAPLILSYSCYNGGLVHCGKCGTCVERKEAMAGFDPTDYLQ